MSDYLGRKKVLVLCAVLFIVSAIGTAVPQSQLVFVVFRAVGGIGVGAASMTSPMYIAEISPARIRGRMVSLNQLAIVFGMLAVYFVNYCDLQRGRRGMECGDRMALDVCHPKHSLPRFCWCCCSSFRKAHAGW